MIAPILIACGERYAKCGCVSAKTYLKYHGTPLYVVVDEIAEELLSGIQSKHLILIPLGTFRKEIEDSVGFNKFYVFKYDQDGKHDRAYSSLKPLIMENVIARFAPKATYTLSLDADTLFSGNILKKVRKELDKVHHRFDLYLVRREDPRMLLTSQKAPGSGFTLWKRDSRFIEMFRKRYGKGLTGPLGGSQSLINLIRQKLPSFLFNDPLLHFVSPDLKNPKITDQEISKIRPAYIHLHGKDSYQRLLRFQRIFEEGI